MVRYSVIVLTSFALMLSSLGVSEVLHTCLMEMSTTANASCAMCGEMDPVDCDDAGAGVSAPRAPSCCSTVETTRYLDAATLDVAFSVLPAPIVFPTDAFDVLLQDRLEPVSVDSYAVDLPPPMLAEQGRHTYLRTSVFLI